MSERILIRDRIITKIDAVKLKRGHFRMETSEQGDIFRCLQAI